MLWRVPRYISTYKCVLDIKGEGGREVVIAEGIMSTYLTTLLYCSPVFEELER